LDLRKDKGFSFSALSLIAKQNFGQYSLELARTWKLFRCTFSGGSQFIFDDFLQVLQLLPVVFLYFEIKAYIQIDQINPRPVVLEGAK
jgi:hypothetical protein